MDGHVERGRRPFTVISMEGYCPCRSCFHRPFCSKALDGRTHRPLAEHAEQSPGGIRARRIDRLDGLASPNIRSKIGALASSARRDRPARRSLDVQNRPGTDAAVRESGHAGFVDGAANVTEARS